METKMESRPVGFKIVEVNTDFFSLVIREKTYSHLRASSDCNEKISLMEFFGTNLISVGIYGEAIKIPNDSGGNCKVAVPPLFFERRDYQFIIRSNNGMPISVWHENRAIREKFENTFDGADEISGIVNFGTDIGYSDFEICAGEAHRFVIRMEVFPTRISYREDFRLMLSEIYDEVYAVAFDSLKSVCCKTQKEEKDAVPFNGLLEIVERVFGDFVSEINKIISAPRCELRAGRAFSSPRLELRAGRNFSSSYRLKRADSGKSVILQESSVRADAGEKNEKNEKNVLDSGYRSVRKITIYNTNEICFLKFIIEKTEKLFANFKARYLRAAEQDELGETAGERIICSACEMLSVLNKKVEDYFPSGAGGYNEAQIMSRTFEAPHRCKEVFRCYKILRQGLEVYGDVFKVTEKDIAVLYEYWCFIKLVRILKDNGLSIVSQNIIKSGCSGVTVTLERGIKSEADFINPRTGEHVYISYGPDNNGAGAAVQTRKNVITIEKTGFGEPYKLVMVAKYRLEAHPDSNYPDINPGPETEDIDMARRFRDAIICGKNIPFTYGKKTFGAFVLFPYDNERLYKSHCFYKSIEKVNTGAIPFLPGAVGLAEEFLSETVIASEKFIFERIPVSDSVERELEKVDWDFRDVLVGSVRGPEQLRQCLSGKYYYVPAVQVEDGRRPVRYVAIYESKLGVRYYGEVVRHSRVKRRRIPFRMTKNNPDELYDVFAVKEWLEREPIAYCEESVYKARGTNLFLIENCRQTYELFCIHSAKQFRLLYDLKNIISRVKDKEKDGKLIFRLDENRYIWIYCGYLNLIDEKGNILYRSEVREFSEKPGSLFLSIARSLEL